MALIECYECGEEVSDKAESCPSCGAPMDQTSPSEKSSPSDFSKVFWLCSLGLIGIAGIHRFYVGRWLSGSVYFLTYGFLGIGTVVDLWVILRGRFENAEGDLVGPGQIETYHSISLSSLQGWGKWIGHLKRDLSSAQYFLSWLVFGGTACSIGMICLIFIIGIFGVIFGSPNKIKSDSNPKSNAFDESMVRASVVSKENRGGQIEIYFVKEGNNQEVFKAAKECVDHYTNDYASAACWGFKSKKHYRLAEVDTTNGGMKDLCWAARWSKPLQGSPDGSKVGPGLMVSGACE